MTNYRYQIKFFIDNVNFRNLFCVNCDGYFENKCLDVIRQFLGNIKLRFIYKFLIIKIN